MLESAPKTGKNDTLATIYFKVTVIMIVVVEAIFTVIWIGVEKFYYHLSWLETLQASVWIDVDYLDWDWLASSSSLPHSVAFWIVAVALAVGLAGCGCLAHYDKSPTILD